MDGRARRLAWALAAIAACGLTAGCSSARFGGQGATVAAVRPVPAPIVNEPPPVEAFPSSPVESEPLPPPPGASGGFGGPAATDVPVTSGSPGPAPTVIANAAPSRSGTVGSYTARDATGSTCRVSLSSSPALDLYRASASSCVNKDLARITAWDFREGEVYLYQPGGSVAARLRGSGGSLSGVLAKSGAPLTLTR